MNAPTQAIRERLQCCLAGRISLDDLYDWIAQFVAESERDPASPGRDMAYEVLNLFYEADAADWSDDDLRDELAMVATIPSSRSLALLAAKLVARPFIPPASSASLDHSSQERVVPAAHAQTRYVAVSA